MKVLRTFWFTSQNGCMGIVVAQDETTGERKAYIAPVSGSNIVSDTNFILDWGCGIHLGIIEQISQLLKLTKEKK